MSKYSKIADEGKFIVVGDFADPASIKHLTFSAITAEGIRDANGAPWLPEFCWPASAYDEVLAICVERARLKKALDDSMALVYKLSGKYTLMG